MATNKKGGRPPTHWWIAEQVYLLVSETERTNPGITRRQAIYKVMDSDKYKNLLNLYYDAIIKIQNNHKHKLADYQNRDMHNPEEIREDMAMGGYMYLEPETGEMFTQEDLDQIKAEYQDIEKQIKKIPPPREPGDTDTGLTDRAYKCLLRMYEVHQKHLDELRKKGLW
tara:strand:+ start:56 stop:562 length:507 start_codon:yes stop_codon:yes gene_type:complete